MRKTFIVLLLWCVALVSWAQGTAVLDQVKADPRRSYGNDYPYPQKTAMLTKAPRGYKPFYISHYSRHGSRYYWNDRLYRDLDSLLSKAHKLHVLTAEGEAFRTKFMAAKDEMAASVSELSQLGWDQHQFNATLRLKSANSHRAPHSTGWYPTTGRIR